MLPVGVTIADANGRILLRNRATVKVWGEQAPVAEGIADYQHFQGWWTATGEPIGAHEWGLARALTRGEVSLGEEAEIMTFEGQRKTILNFAALSSMIREPSPVES